MLSYVPTFSKTENEQSKNKSILLSSLSVLRDITDKDRIRAENPLKAHDKSVHYCITYIKGVAKP